MRRIILTSRRGLVVWQLVLILVIIIVAVLLFLHFRNRPAATTSASSAAIRDVIVAQTKAHPELKISVKGVREDNG